MTLKISTIKVFLWIPLMAFISIPQNIFSQTEKDALFVKEIYNSILEKGQCYEWLRELSEGIGGRLAGSKEAENAVEYTYQLMQSVGFDNVIKQECEVNKWIRGDKEQVQILLTSNVKIDIPALALGNSIGTGEKGILAHVVEVQSLDSLESLGEELLKDKIVFFNRPMDPKQLRTFNAYGGAVDQRVYGAARAARFGAKAVLVRSLTTLQDDNPHTGVSAYEEGVEKIPAIAISTNGANMLSELLAKQELRVFIKNNSYGDGVGISHNVIAEIKGSEFPNEIILVGGHLDSWDVGGGAHDDGAGCVHAIQAIKTLIDLGYQPKRTLRCVMFMNEENGLAGGLEYAKQSNEKNEFHLAAIESDAGGFTPRGFSCDAEADVFNDFFRELTHFLPILEAYDLSLKKGGSGADINPLKSQKGMLIGFRPDSQRYFDFHHSEKDVLEAVNERELKLGAAAISSLLYLIDKYGLTRDK